VSPAPFGLGSSAVTAGASSTVGSAAGFGVVAGVDDGVDGAADGAAAPPLANGAGDDEPFERFHITTPTPTPATRSSRNSLRPRRLPPADTCWSTSAAVSVACWAVSVARAAPSATTAAAVAACARWWRSLATLAFLAALAACLACLRACLLALLIPLLLDGRAAVWEAAGVSARTYPAGCARPP
jgi:hypothetical protein